MTDTEPDETTHPFDTKECSQYVASSIALREGWKAELTDALARAKAALNDAQRLENQLSTDEYLDVAESNDWLSGDDLGAFNALLENAYSSLCAADAVNRPHPGDPLWPRTEAWHNSSARTEYGVEYTTAQDIMATDVGFTRRPKHYLGGFNTEYAANAKNADLLANGTILTGAVKMREHSATDWATPSPTDDNE